MQNTATSFNIELRKKGKKCTVFGSDLKVQLAEGESYSYPDVGIVCGPPQFVHNRKDIITNPLVIVEVLSPSTRHYDKRAKFRLYQGLASLREYILIEPSEALVESWYRVEEGGDLWRYSVAEGLDANIPVYAIESELALSDLYFGLEFQQEGEAEEKKP